MINMLRRLLIGKPLHNKEIAHERLPRWKALSIFSSDALSSVAYGPEQIMLTLLSLPGIIAYGFMSSVAISILLLLIVVAASYVQVAKANPVGGGAYTVAKKNLGEFPALVAAGSVFADYVLTAAVSVSAGTAAIVSAFPEIASVEVAIDLTVLFGVLMLVNLRGIRESSNAFVFPTYAFLLGMLALLLAGIFRSFTGSEPLIPTASLVKQEVDITVIFLILRAFANGCSSMTGIEAIADSVPLFRNPESKNAVKTTYWMAGILGIMFIGISFLIMHFHIMPMEDVTALSQLAEKTFGRNYVYYYIQCTTMLVLYLAANTAYNGLPVLMSIVAKDGYLPRFLGARGERLNFSNGIIVLTIAAATLIVVYHGNTEHLISLYAVGVFISFTIAQTGMIVHWKRERSDGWRFRAVLNGLGALVTGLVVIIITATKFMYGAWIILLYIPIMIWIFKKIRSHYDSMAEQLHAPEKCTGVPMARRNYVIVPVATPTRIVAETIAYARTISQNVIALHISTDEEATQRALKKWEAWDCGVDLVVVSSPYRLFIQPVLEYIEQLQQKKRAEDYITVLVTEFETKKWWHRLLHNQTGWILRTILILRKEVVVATIPYHLRK